MPKTNTIMENQNQELQKDQRKDLYSYDWRKIFVDENFNTREKEEYGDLEALANDIATRGLQTPLRVMTTSDGRKFLVDGHRRFKAMSMRNMEDEKAGRDYTFPMIQCLTLGAYNREKALEFVLSSGLDDTKITLGDVSVARTLARLKDLHYSVQRLAEIRNKSVTWVNNMLLLDAQPEVVKNAIRSGAISTTEAINRCKILGDYDTVLAHFDEELKKLKAEEEAKAKLEAEATTVVSTNSDKKTKPTKKPKMKSGGLKKTHASVYEALFDKVTKKATAPALETLVQHLATPVAKLDADTMRELENAMQIIVGKLND